VIRTVSPEPGKYAGAYPTGMAKVAFESPPAMRHEAGMGPLYALRPSSGYCVRQPPLLGRRADTGGPVRIAGGD